MDIKLCISGRTGWFVAACVLAMPLIAAAQTVTILSTNVAPGPLYNGTAGSPSTEWLMPGASLSGSAIVGVDGLVMNPGLGTVSWTGSDLGLDASAGNVAYGQFLSGGLLQITGQVFGSYNYTGLLFEGIVGVFEVEETYPNRLDILGQPLVTPTSNPAAFLNAQGLLGPAYVLSMQGVLASEDNGDVLDFNGNIASVAGAQLSLIQIPEPATVVLLLASVVGLPLARRRMS